MADVIKEHKELFENWLNSTRKNSTLINRNDLESIRSYLIAIKNGSNANLNERLKKRMKKHNMFLSNFPSSPDCICCSKKSKGVLVSPIFIDLVAFYLVILTIKDWLTVMFMFCCSLKKPSREAAFPAFLPHSPPPPPPHQKRKKQQQKHTHTRIQIHPPPPFLLKF